MMFAHRSERLATRLTKPLWMLSKLLGKKKHLAAVYDTRPTPGDKHQFDPYFVAMCDDCGWIGAIRRSSEAAFADAHDHTPHVLDAIKRPLG